MSKIQLLWAGMAFLLLLNLITLGMLQFQRPPGPPGPHNRGGRADLFIIDKLQLTPEQTNTYRSMIERHKYSVDSLEQLMMSTRRQLFETLNGSDSTLRDSLLLAVGRQQSQMENIHYRHFMEIKSICTPQQQPAFRELTTELERLFGAGKKMPRPPKE